MDKISRGTEQKGSCNSGRTNHAENNVSEFDRVKTKHPVLRCCSSGIIS